MPSGLYIRTKEILAKQSEAQRGEKSHKWKGSNAGYRAIHMWIQKHLGNPSQCQACNKIGDGHFMHWANVSDQYKREKEDWLRLCAKCHKAFDMLKKQIVPDIV